MVRKIIQIDEAKCNGCGICAAVCHEEAILASGKQIPWQTAVISTEGRILSGPQSDAGKNMEIANIG